MLTRMMSQLGCSMALIMMWPTLRKASPSWVSTPSLERSRRHIVCLLIRNALSAKCNFIKTSESTFLRVATLVVNISQTIRRVTRDWVVLGGTRPQRTWVARQRSHLGTGGRGASPLLQCSRRDQRWRWRVIHTREARHTQGTRHRVHQIRAIASPRTSFSKEHTRRKAWRIQELSCTTRREAGKRRLRCQVSTNEKGNLYTGSQNLKTHKNCYKRVTMSLGRCTLE